MKIKSDDWLYITGKAKYGKTTWIKEHARAIPPERLYILDYNANDYTEFVSTPAHVWQVRTGLKEEVAEFASITYRRGNCFDIFSESDAYFDSDNPSINMIVRTGRNRGIGAMVDGKRPMSIRPSFRTRFNYLVLFHTDLPEDIEYLEKWAGQPKGSFQILRSLQTGEHIIVNLDDQTVSGVKKLILTRRKK
jgi:hypothetical protein